jgi:alkanesulfonate monooxygenase SsuD/methylene tetrahydromethanopterin reductase-like flavin-dependent oxidoreductase (luciferase family)
MKANGRDPAHCKLLYLVTPIVADTHEEALAKQERWFNDPLYIEYMLAEISSITEIDFAQFDLDEPVPPDVSTNGERGALESFLARGKGKTLRQIVTGSGLSGNVPFVGTPAEVADEMGAVMDQVGGDGYLITSPVMRLNRRYVTEITDGLVPELQKRGLVRSEYTTTMLRDHLREF